MDNKTQLKQLEKRRLRAGRLLLKDIAQAEVARRVGVARSTVCGWAKKLEAEGLDGLRSQGLRGRPASLDRSEQRRLKRILLKGDVWTLPRVREVLRKQFKVTLSVSQVSRVLGSLGFSCQRPTGRAVQRDERAIREWKTKRWPALKNTPKNKVV